MHTFSDEGLVRAKLALIPPLSLSSILRAAFLQKNHSFAVYMGEICDILEPPEYFDETGVHSSQNSRHVQCCVAGVELVCFEISLVNFDRSPNKYSVFFPQEYCLSTGLKQFLQCPHSHGFLSAR